MEDDIVLNQLWKWALHVEEDPVALGVKHTQFHVVRERVRKPWLLKRWGVFLGTGAKYGLQVKAITFHGWW